MRRGRPSLLGTVARTAVISGTATRVSGNVAHKQQQKFAAEAAAAQPAPAAAPAPAPAPVAAPVAAPPPAAPPVAEAPSGGDRLGQLRELGELRAAGVLTEAEFEAEKARILAG